jgi:hypothetical protein
VALTGKIPRWNVGGPRQNKRMESTGHALRDLASRLGDATRALVADGDVPAASDAELLTLMQTAAGIARHAEAVLVEATAEVTARSDTGIVADRFTARHGARNASELVQRVTRVSGRTARDVVRAAAAVAEPVSVTTGERLPAAFPGMRAALIDGAVGLDGLVAVTGVVGDAARSTAHRLAADAELAAAARGEGAAAGPAPSADDLRVQAQVWAMFLDPDGAEPADAIALRTRGVTLGPARDGVIPIRGQLLPDVAGQLQRIFDSILNPKNSSPGPVFTEPGDTDEANSTRTDFRTRPQRQHDALATALSVAARAGELPTIGGGAPTLLVSVTADDLAGDGGFAHIDGIDSPVAVGVARQAACSGGIYRVTHDAFGRIIDITVSDRIFTAHQRKAITLRDGGCIIPGCSVPAAWCEIHHVLDAARGGPTSTDNGVLLCWSHHRTLEVSGWQIRMNRGAPEIRGPSWWDPTRTWRPATKSPTRLRRRAAARV